MATAAAVVGRAATTVTTQTTAAARRREKGREGGREGGREREQPAGAGQTTCVMMPSADEDGFLVPALPLDPLVTGFEEVVP